MKILDGVTEVHGDDAVLLFSHCAAMLSLDAGCTDRITTALVDELAAPTADSATRIRLTQALVELAGTTAQEVLRQLAHDDDGAVALAFERVGATGEIRHIRVRSARCLPRGGNRRQASG